MDSDRQGNCITIDHEKPMNTGDSFKIETAQNGEDNLKNGSRHVQIDERNEIALLLFLTDVGSLIFRIAATWLCSKFSFGDILVVSRMRLFLPISIYCMEGILQVRKDWFYL